MGVNQIGVLTVGTLVLKEGEHTLLHSTLLVCPPSNGQPLFIVGSPKVIALGHVPCDAWSTRHSLTLGITSMGVQGTTQGGAGLQK